MTLKTIFIFVVLLISFHINGQNSDSLMVNQIDSLISLIPSNNSRNNFYNIIQASGRIDKKILGLFKKRIGSLSSDVIYHDTLIYSIENIYSYTKDNKTLSETFYYMDNKLIKYIKRLSDNPDLKPDDLLKHKIIAYFNKNKLIELTEKINDDYTFDLSEQLKIIGIANTEIIINLESLKQLNNYAPGTPDIKIRREINE
jgi:hypothetical protein